MAQCGFAARFKTEGGLAKNIGRDGLNHGIGPFVLGADCGRALANRVAEDESRCVNPVASEAAAICVRYTGTSG